MHCDGVKAACLCLGGRGGGGGVDQSVERSLTETELQAQMDTQESKSVAMEKALQKLDALVSDAMTIEKEPSSPERLSADIEVAAAAKQALQLLRAIQVLAYLS